MESSVRRTSALQPVLSRQVEWSRTKGFVTPPRACGILSSPVAKRMKKISYRGYRFPPEIIFQAIWLYLRFTLSLRDVEDLLRNAEWPYSMRRFGAG